MHDTRKHRNCRHNHHHHHLGWPPDRRQGAQMAHAAHAMHMGSQAPPDAHSDSDEPPDGTAAHARWRSKNEVVTPTTNTSGGA